MRKASRKANVIKIADRLHNMRTLQFRSRKEQEKVARDTLKTFLPIFVEKTKKVNGINVRCIRGDGRSCNSILV